MKKPSYSVDIASVPLAVDLDGTLTYTDTLVEALVLLARINPVKLVTFLFVVVKQGKAKAKEWLANMVQIDVTSLPYNEPLLAFLKAEKAQKGRTLILATASHLSVAKAVAKHLNIFDAVIGSEQENLSGPRKAARLEALFGPRGFAYAGNAAVDLAVWKNCGGAVVVNGSKALGRAAAKATTVEAVFAAPKVNLRTWRRVLRTHQWAKNTLLFAPLLLAHNHLLKSWMTCGIGFISYSLCASSAYILNDLLDLPDDRQHAEKKRRPFAAGKVSIFAGLLLFPLLFLAGLGLGFLVSPAFALVVGGYYAATLAYSLSLKRKPLIDIFWLAALYTWRIFAGAVATSTHLSEWMLGFSIFAFLSLAMVKRCSELKATIAKGQKLISGRGYQVDDIALVETFGAATSCTAVLILAIYIASPDVARLYSHPRILLLIGPLILFWFVRVWYLTHKQRMHSDPIVFAINDRATYIIAAMVLALGYLAV